LEALRDSQPDALLCDIFFYENATVAAEMEKKVQEKARELHEFGRVIGANRPQAGVELIQQATARYKKRFPIYAYTSKGPYLLDENAFDQIAEAGARWLFKGKYGSLTEQLILSQDIEEFREKNSVLMLAFRYFWASLFASGIIGGVVVWLLTEVVVRHWLHWLQN
jgi:hypothetical protein